MHASAWTDIDALCSGGVFDTLVAEGRVIGTRPIDLAAAPPALAGSLPAATHRLLEHDRIPFVSYPYEWPFSLLKRAALHHLDLQLDLLRSGFTMSDASAFNIQFRGTRPVFIDVLSIRRYQEGEYWPGYRQFCEQFLNPLLLSSLKRVPYQPWFRGQIDGISLENVARILSWRTKLSWPAFLHITLHSRLASRADRHMTVSAASGVPEQPRPMSKTALTWLVMNMRNWINRLRPPRHRNTGWGAYHAHTSYTPGEAESKRAFVASYIGRLKPSEVVDLGCNDGTFSEIAMSAGARRVIGFDFDSDALEVAISRADGKSLDFLPLLMDAANPSPDQGWAQKERRGLLGRLKPDGILALAFLHHLVIARNVPLARALKWLIELAPSGVIEFVPKQDPQVQRLLRHRVDIFEEYGTDEARRLLSELASITKEQVISRSGRTLFEYQR